MTGDLQVRHAETAQRTLRQELQAEAEARRASYVKKFEVPGSAFKVLRVWGRRFHLLSQCRVVMRDFTGSYGLTAS